MRIPRPVPAPVPAIALRIPLAIPTTIPSMKAPAKRRQNPARAPLRTPAPPYVLVSMASRMNVSPDGGRVVPRHLDALHQRRMVLEEDVVPPGRARIVQRLRPEQPEQLTARARRLRGAAPTGRSSRRA